jgi:DNA ligase (NAD+)
VIKKAGDVIPQIKQVIKLKNIGSWLPLSVCPSCNSELKWNSTNIYQLCLNDNCPQKTVNFLAHFASKRGIDIKGISHKNIKKLYENNLLKSPVDFYLLFSQKKQLLKLEGFQKKSVDNMLSSIENSKKKPLANLLTALGIPLLSSVKAQKLTNFYPNSTAFLRAIENEEWDKIKEILGEETHQAMKKYFQKLPNLKLVKELSEIRNRGELSY